VFAIHLRSALHQIAYEPFLSSLTVHNAAKIEQLEIILWGNYNEDNGDTVSFGTENFGIALQNLIYVPKLVVPIDLVIKTKIEIEEDESSPGSVTFCAFDWLMATFAGEWFFDRTYFDLFRGVAAFHMSRMFPQNRFRTCESRWFREARATPDLLEHERRSLWDLEDRYGLSHQNEIGPSDQEQENLGSEWDDEDVVDDSCDKDSDHNRDGRARTTMVKK
jgi:hypothetical protein